MKTTFHHATRVPRVPLAGAVLALLLLVLGCVGAERASALADQGHVFDYSFGEAGAAPGQLSAPSGGRR